MSSDFEFLGGHDLDLADMTAGTRADFLRKAALAAAAVGGLSLVVSEKGRAAGNRLTVDTTFITPFAISNASYFYLAAGLGSGTFKKQGLEVKIASAGGSSQGIQALIGGAAQFTSGSFVTNVIARSQGAKLTTVAQINQASPFALCSRSSAPFKTAADLRGKTIGVASSRGETQNLLQLILRRGNIPITDVPQPIVGTGAAPYALMNSGRIDGYLDEINNLQQLRRNGVSNIYIKDLEDFAPTPGNGITVTRDFLAQNRDLTIKFIAAVYGGITYAQVKANRPRVAQWISEYHRGVNAEVAAFQMPYRLAMIYRAGPQNVLEIPVQKWRNALVLLQNAEVIDKKITVDQVVNTGLVKPAKRIA
jgi:ABC-type nitrate/sulfonate/bicarbonate transport system substrate-binding protein